ncbi:MAG: SUMF1/EgtB/PvdO family nonheme iron enzyme, partial [Gemmatimonadales bacterium]
MPAHTASNSSQGEGSVISPVTAAHRSDQFRIMLQRLSEAQVLFSKKANGCIEPELVHISAGKFWMGSIDADPFAHRDEKPGHQLYLPEYWIGRYPVTVAEYSLFL